MKRKLMLSTGVLLFAGAASCFANVIPYNLVSGQLVAASQANFTPINFVGTGFGASNTILTLQNTGTEAGCVVAVATASQTCGSINFNNGGGIADVLTGASQIGTPTLATLGVTSGNNLLIVFVGNQPAGGNLAFNSLALFLYGSGGSVVSFTCPLCSSLTIPNTLVGTGQSGFIFALDSQQAQSATDFISTHGGTGTVRVGIGASISGAAGGAEVFDAGTITGLSVPSAAVPEPGSAFLLVMGMIGLSCMSRRVLRRK